MGCDNDGVNYSVVLSRRQLITGPPITTVSTDAFLPTVLMPRSHASFYLFVIYWKELLSESGGTDSKEGKCEAETCSKIQ